MLSSMRSRQFFSLATHLNNLNSVIISREDRKKRLIRMTPNFITTYSLFVVIFSFPHKKRSTLLNNEKDELEHLLPLTLLPVEFDTYCHCRRQSRESRKIRILVWRKNIREEWIAPDWRDQSLTPDWAAVIRLDLQESLAGEKARIIKIDPPPLAPSPSSQCQIISKFLPR